MKAKYLFVFAAMLGMSALAYAQSPVGTWTGETQGRGGRGGGMMTLVLNADMTGSFIGGQGNEFELEEVMIEGSMVSFKATGTFGQDTSIALTISAEVDGDTMTLTFVSIEGLPEGRGGRGGGGQAFVLTRQ